MVMSCSERVIPGDRLKRDRRQHAWPALVLGVACLLCPLGARAEGGERAVASPEPSVVVERGLLTLSVEGISFHALLRDIAQQAGFEIRIDPAVEDSIISAELHDLPLEESLRDLLSSYDTFVFYRASDQQPAVLRSIWVHPPGTAEGLAPREDCPQGPAVEDPLGDLDSPVAAERLRALGFAAAAGDQFAADALERGLQDEDEVVRYQALVKMGQRAMVVSDAEANRILASDPSPLVRAQALENMIMLLGNADERVRLAAEAALNDHDDSVREMARGVLDAASRPQEPSTAPEDGANAAAEPTADAPADLPPPDDPGAREGD